jgi:hypothetical protein
VEQVQEYVEPTRIVVLISLAIMPEKGYGVDRGKKGHQIDEQNKINAQGIQIHQVPQKVSRPVDKYWRYVQGCQK